jgi:hypothetical protein
MPNSLKPSTINKIEDTNILFKTVTTPISDEPILVKRKYSALQKSEIL